MKAKILLLIIFSGLILCCRSKHKMTTTYKENKKETGKEKVDFLSVQSLESNQSTSTDFLLMEKKSEISGDVLINGKSDVSSPFIFHNVVGRDTLQRISITGNAEYSIRNYYTKVSNEKTENRKDESIISFQDVAQKTISKEAIKEETSEVFEETKKTKVTGFEVAAWIFITVVGITFILIFFTYKYFKK